MGQVRRKIYLEKNKLKLYLSWKSGCVFFKPCCYYQKTLSIYSCSSLFLKMRLSLAVGGGGDVGWGVGDWYYEVRVLVGDVRL